MSDGINWAPVPAPEDERPMLLILPAPLEGRTQLVLLNDDVCGVWTHYTDGRTIPCVRGHGCPCEDRKSMGTRWKGYIGAQLHNRQIVLLELTASACRDGELTRFELWGPTLRGRRAEVWRRRPGQAGAVVIRKLPGERIDEMLLPRRPDVMWELQRVWCAKR